MLMPSIFNDNLFDDFFDFPFYDDKADRKIQRKLYGHHAGNRLIMMHEGKIIYDVSGEEKKNLKVADLLAKFEEVSGGEFANDRMMLS